MARFSFPLWVFIATSVVWLEMKSPRESLRSQAFYLVMGLISVPLLIWASWVEWTTLIVTDEIGIRWKGLRLLGQFRWGEISGLGFQRQVATPTEPTTTLKVWLLEAGICKLHLPPFPSPALS